MANGTGPLIVVFVHGWSATSTETYGEFPDRLAGAAATEAGLRLDVRHIWLGKYISFHDEVRLEDVSRAFEAALRRELGSELDKGRRFVCITHSTGGPVVRDWFDRYYHQKERVAQCPLSHLVMLAPANFGSALAQLGKGRVSRLKSWVAGVEPGQGILDWLELGSPESWELNRSWIGYDDLAKGPTPVYFFVLAGQQIDRKLYDHVNPYTGELGSDGVVRVASANLNARYVQLEQRAPSVSGNSDAVLELAVSEIVESPRTAFALVAGQAHSGEDMGILRGIKNDGKPHPTVDLVLQCMRVKTPGDYEKLCQDFAVHTASVMQDELVEKETGLLTTRRFIHDPCSMVIFRIRDDKGYIVDKFDLVLTAGAENSPDQLPEGFLKDRQRNTRHKGTLTFFLNHALLVGSERVPLSGRVIRPATKGVDHVGIQIHPYDTDGFVRYAPAELAVAESALLEHVRPHQTLLVDIVLRRIVGEGVFQMTQDRQMQSFKDQEPGKPVSP